ncbi:GNAT family N-acetyltransferase [Mycetocola reblochoni]|uniref:N-acetyltransferase n=2 Tax=Mycetocola reblochoni TaxID=331618 RepID=A0A3L6ZIP7_9MICO|nr:GNAT family protein [Mycetocola reblochoni]RLP67909.1 N-acetyltransferase [Mycetocola reblochoni]SJN21238.1 putative acetyltransferase [Mycetocola reblochoni REB411]
MLDRPAAVPLIGSAVRLDPLADADAEPLFAAICFPEVFTGGYAGGPGARPDTVDGFRSMMDGYLRRGGENIVFTVRLIGGPDDGAVVGTTSLGHIDPANELLHLGWTAYAPAVWGTVVNAETKRLLIRHVFDAGYGRVHIQADSRNERSRRAIERLGAQFEGVLRRQQRRADGSWRDTAVYSILAAEWPGIELRLDERIAAAVRPVVLGEARA